MYSLEYDDNFGRPLTEMDRVECTYDELEEEPRVSESEFLGGATGHDPLERKLFVHQLSHDNNTQLNIIFQIK